MAGISPLQQRLAAILHEQQTVSRGLDGRLARACLSHIEGRAIGKDEFRTLLSSLVDRSILSPLGEDLRELQWSDGGRQRNDVLRENAPGKVADQAEFLIREYEGLEGEDARAAFCNEVLSGLPGEGKVSVRRADQISADGLSVNASPVLVEDSEEPIHVARYVLEDRDRLKFEEPLDKILNKFIDELDRSLPEWALGWVDPDEVLVVASTEPLPEWHNYYGATLKRVENELTDVLPEGRERWLVEALLHRAIDDTLAGRPEHWHKERFEHAHFNYSERATTDVRGLRFTEYPGFKIDLITVRADRKTRRPDELALIVDPKTRQQVTIADWLESNQPAQSLLQASEAFEGKAPFHTIPEYTLCHLEDPGDLADGELHGSVRLQRHYGNKGLLKDAAEVAIHKDVLEDAFGQAPQKPPAAKDPGARSVEALDWIHNVLPNHIRAKRFTFTIERGTQDVSALSTAVNPLWRLNPPQLRFHGARQRESVSTDPRDLFRYGPNCGPLEVRLVGVIAPTSFPRKSIEAFAETVSEAFSSSNLGKLHVGQYDVITYEGRNTRAIQNGLSGLSMGRADREILLSITPASAGNLYGQIKDLAAGVAGVPCQNCNLRTARAIASGKITHARGLALQLLLKSLDLDSGDVPWVLEDVLPEKETLYVGIGYSKEPSTGREETSHASLSLAHGQRPRMESLEFSLRPNRYLDKVTAERLIKFLQVETAKHPEIERVAVLRKGDVYPAEIEAISSAHARSEAPWDLDFIGVTGSNLRVFRRDPLPANPEAGLMFVLDDDRCLLSMSTLPGTDLPTGSVQLLELRRALGTTPIAAVGREVYDQAFLCWGSPARPPKLPMPLDLANKYAELALSTTRDEALRGLIL